MDHAKALLEIKASGLKINAIGVALICSMVLAAIAPSYSAFAQQRSVAACRAEWRANKAANQAAGKTEKAYIAECRSGAASQTAPPAPRGAEPTGGMTAQPAKTHCPGDTVVWANTASRIYHFSGHRSYGTTKSGAYMCERDTTAAGFRAAKNEKHP
jgi:hypothetical protein